MTRRTLASPAGRKTTEAFALAFEPGAAPGTAPSGDGSPNRNRIAARDRGGIRVMPGTATPRAFECKPFGRTVFTMSNPAAFNFHSFALPGGAGDPSGPKNADTASVALLWDNRGEDDAADLWMTE